MNSLKQVLKTSHKNIVKIEQQAVLQLLSKADTEVALTHNNEILRRHFLQLTESFLIPLERYFASLMPLAKYIAARCLFIHSLAETSRSSIEPLN